MLVVAGCCLKKGRYRMQARNGWCPCHVAGGRARRGGGCAAHTARALSCPSMELSRLIGDNGSPQLLPPAEQWVPRAATCSWPRRGNTSLPSLCFNPGCHYTLISLRPTTENSSAWPAAQALALHLLAAWIAASSCGPFRHTRERRLRLVRHVPFQRHLQQRQRRGAPAVSCLPTGPWHADV